jgi:hypothetical protein
MSSAIAHANCTVASTWPRRESRASVESCDSEACPCSPYFERRSATERAADRDLPLAARAAHEQQVRDIRAHDREYDADGDDEHSQRRRYRGRKLVERAHDLETRRGTGLRFDAAQLQPERVGLRARRLERNSGGELRLRGQEKHLARPGRRCHEERRPERLLAKTRRHDAHDRVRPPIELDPTLDDVGGGQEILAPHRLAEHDDVRVRPLVVGQQAASHERRYAAHGEQPRGNSLAVELHAAVGSGQRAPFALHDRDVRQSRRILPPPVELADAHGGSSLRDAPEALRGRNVLDDRHEPLGLGERERPEQHGVHDAEDRGRRTEPDREREHRDGRESRSAFEATQRITYVGRDFSS